MPCPPDYKLDPPDDPRVFCETCNDTGKVEAPRPEGHCMGYMQCDCFADLVPCPDCPQCWCDSRRNDGKDHRQCHLIP